MLKDRLIPVQPVSGIYFLSRGGAIVYIGQSMNIYSRIAAHEKDKEFDSACYFHCAREDMDDIERTLIQSFQPEYNKVHNDMFRFHEGRGESKVKEAIRKRVGAKMYDKKTEVSLKELGFL